MPVPFVTLDSLHTKDIDDAFRVSMVGDGYLVEVAIANAALHVPVDSPDDVFARAVAATTYAGKRTVTHMLPPHISEGVGSLLAGSRRPAVVYEIELSSTLDVVRFGISERTVKVGHRLSYELLSHVLEDSGHSAHQSVKTASGLSKMLLARRRASGALAFFDMRRLLVSSEEGRPLRFETSAEAVGYILVQELMVLANCEGAKYLVRHNIPAIYRNHVAKLASPPAREVAESVQMLLSAGAADMPQIEQTVGLIAAVAEYGETVRGHYGLTVPAYAHLTSPLRRFADLVNQRQLVAHLNAKALPYSQDDIGVIARSINETLLRQKRERKESFKTALNEKASRALDRAHFKHLAEHEMIKAVEIGAAAGQLPDPLVQELTTRFSENLVADRLAYATLLHGLDQKLPRGLSDVCSRWLELAPGKALSFLTHASNVGRILKLHVETRTVTPIPPSFEAVASASVKGREDVRVGASATQPSKRAAEQFAVLRLTGCLTGLTLVTPDDVAVTHVPVDPGLSIETRVTPEGLPARVLTAKNQLVELHQKLRWPAPVYSASAQGEAHRLAFRCIVTLKTPEGEVTGTASGASTKKQAEMLAAAALLEKLDMHRVGRRGPRAASANAVSALNEWTQEHKLSAPVYSFWSRNPDTPPFVCKVTIEGADGPELPGARGNNKQEAKLRAAEAALKLLRANRR
ncbi:hypothetical protein WJ97_11575 [Burkholderia ubonensis]|uniref:RNB domain-containing ribonuclease n=1 Tax=Burkholderia ubonensis TaxID=101571 RepID=UPI0007559CF8|nr:RNB domain-containing ribonuclease [Burkholderia ubonensis]KVP96518.1 hypothetical protein WJ97_11575 [Burkholderia ubonensis]